VGNPAKRRSEYTAEITVHADRPKGTISKYLYSHFAENLGRCFYEGIWVGPGSDIPNEDGLRLDTANALRELELACIRLPGGNFADNYHWMDGIGPSEKRPARYNANWGLVDDNSFGTHEYIRFCKMIGAEPYFCANVGSGTVEEARAWVEYCNLRHPTALTKLRAENGGAEPFGVKFWAVGNESWGAGGKMCPQFYGDEFKRYALYMRMTDPTIKLVLCGSHGTLPGWDEAVLERTSGSDLVDLLGFHCYFGNMPDISYTDDEYYGILDQIEWMNKSLRRVTGLCRAYSTRERPVKVAFDEWGVWCKEAFKSPGLEQRSTMLNGIFTALAFHAMHEYNEDLYMANGSETVNALQALILTDGAAMCRTPSYYAYKLLKPHKEGQLLNSDTVAPPIKAPSGEAYPSVSVSSSLKEGGGVIYVSLVNVDLAQYAKVKIQISGRAKPLRAEASVLGPKNVRDCNIPGRPEQVCDSPLDVILTDGAAELLLPPHSVTMAAISF